MELLSEQFPQVIIDDSDKELFTLVKPEADNMFDGDVNEDLVYYLIKKQRMIRFSHDFLNNRLYVDFPEISSINK